ncbi:sensor histidine kinase [Cereibacter changlensis]|uniref:sensor histidine kinase n=1 Tax=Cereibacter changlensis TaxID=402884 RepID=UPI00403341E6
MARTYMNRSRWGYEELRRAMDAAGVALWSWNLDNDAFAMDAHGYRLWDVPPREGLMFEHLSEKIHPADRDRVREAFAATRTAPGAYEIDFRTLIGKEVRWISARGHGADAEIVERETTGIFIDVTGRKQAEEGSELLAGEMSHRVKNLLAIASGLTRLTSRSSSSVEDMTLQLTQRLTALGRAHDLVRPLPGNQGDAALLGDLFAVLLAPYDDKGAFAGRIRIAVPRMGVGENAAASLALVVHELATNSLKYGALSADAGMLDVSGTLSDESVEIVWNEQGGPEVTATPEQRGYGSRLVRQTVDRQLGGSISYDWTPGGPLITLVFRSEMLAS